MLDVAIIGCGVVGAAAAYELSHYPLHTAIFEAENDVADCTTKANSAILHAGYDPEPGTRMARLNVEGVALAKEICARLDVPYRQCGSLVLALSPAELPHLQKLYENGLANGVPGIRLLSAEETRAMEPGLSPEVAGALYAPSAAIVSPWEYALAMAEVAVRNGVELHLSSPVTGIQKTASGWALTTPSGVVEARYVVNAAGIRADAVHDMAAPHRFTIQPTRGEYYLLDKSEGTRVQHVIFQCPNENGKGVLVAPTVHGNLIVGPNAEPVAGDNTACTAAGLAFVSAAARRSVPDIRFGESIRNFAGVRANVDTGDFVIGEAEGAPGFIDLAGMKSPGLSSAPAVAKEVVRILEGHGDLPAATWCMCTIWWTLFPARATGPEPPPPPMCSTVRPRTRLCWTLSRAMAWAIPSPSGCARRTWTRAWRSRSGCGRITAPARSPSPAGRSSWPGSSASGWHPARWSTSPCPGSCWQRPTAR